MIWDICRALGTRLENWRMSVQAVSDSTHYTRGQCTENERQLTETTLLAGLTIVRTEQQTWQPCDPPPS